MKLKSTESISNAVGNEKPGIYDPYLYLSPKRGKKAQSNGLRIVSCNNKDFIIFDKMNKRLNKGVINETGKVTAQIKTYLKHVWS